MRVSYEWLKSMVDVPQDPKDLVEEFVRTGTEVEAIDEVGADISGVVTSQVLEKTPHPDSDHMFVCKMDVGSYHTDAEGKPEPLQVVCGAQNFEVGDKTITALEGACLPGGIKIKKGKLRGVESCGMNCSESELGLAKDSRGILILPADAPVGVDFCEWRGIRDTVIDCEITPNRPDCLSMEGMALEVSAMLDESTHIETPVIKGTIAEKTSDVVDVHIADKELCSRYTARVLRNVRVQESPDWLKKRLIACGTRPINNIVDITNYVLYLTGHPLHAFDLNKISECEDGKRHIVIRPARTGEKLTTLDEEERTLTDDMIVISDTDKTAICLAGVMGGNNSEIDETTTDVLLESAVFNAGHTSRTSRNLDLISESSIRFERQVDASSCARVSDIASALLQEYADAQVCEGMVDEYPQPVEAVKIHLRPSRVCALAGAEIPVDFMSARLRRLGCTVEVVSDDELVVEAPTFRFDLTREIDLVEEIVRLWGEGDIAPTLPAARNHAGGLTYTQMLTRLIGRSLRASGMSETSTYNFADPRDLTSLGIPDVHRGVPVKILRPLVADQSEMRRDMLPGLMRAVRYNLDHGVANVHLYEIGRVFFGDAHKSSPEEPSFVTGVMCGSWDDDTWTIKSRPLDFFDAKGVLEALFETLRLKKVRFCVADMQAYPWLQPGCAAEVFSEGESLGWVGVLHPQSSKNFGIDVRVIAFELSLEKLIAHAHADISYEDVPTLPGVSLDLAIVVPEELEFESILQRVKSAGGPLLREVKLFDMYRDDTRVGVGKKSLAFSLTYRADDHTLTSSEVDGAHQKLLAKIAKSCQAEIRS